MKLPHAVPCPNGTDRARRAKQVRDIATETARLRPHAQTRTNAEEDDYASAKFPSNFTKGLQHNQYGILADGNDYAAFVEALNSNNNNLFTSGMFAAQHKNPLEGEDMNFRCEIRLKPMKRRERCGCDEVEVKKGRKGKPDWRGWESPRAGHVYDLEGPDSGSVAMAPAPRIVSSEVAAEMAEVYALALLRDVRFTDITSGRSAKKLCDEGGNAAFTSAKAADLLNGMSFYSGKNVISSTLRSCEKLCGEKKTRAEIQAEAESGKCLDAFERNRRFARTQDHDAPYTAELTAQTIFRGSTKGALVGPYISQFMLIGSPSLATRDTCSGPRGNASNDATKGVGDGFIRFGTQFIDQRVTVHKPCLDHMTDWNHWLDVQNGANLKGLDKYRCTRRFITTPRDLATYVHFDALYQAYLNAVLILDSLGTPVSKGFPEPSFVDGTNQDFMLQPARTGFATFGGPHILSLVTEVATRCLKAVRRQKFNFHRRGRPELLGGRLSLLQCGHGEELGCAEADFQRLLDELPDDLLAKVRDHNAAQNNDDMAKMREIYCGKTPKWFNAKCNLLLPMAFPEGSPMHASYGAGHATVAGGCVTMVKAFFEMFEDCDSHVERPLCFDGEPLIFTPDEDGSELVNHRFNAKCELVPEKDFKKLSDKDRKAAENACCKALTIQGELDKLAANISIGRNMAGVHYYSDYYDSLRMGERVAVGILLEQAPCYNEPVETTFTSFDGDHITISGQGDSAGMLTIRDRHGSPVSPRDWWLRHVAGEELIQDL